MSRRLANPGTDVYDYKLPKIIAASSVGTMIEWYDFYIFGTLFGIVGAKFFPGESELADTLSTLALFWVGFAVRPFGAVVFGRVGDIVGRKYTFLVTISIMGGATFAMGLMPTFDSIGWFAPLLLVILRIAQGLALGGEYGGAAIYVAEHAPDDQRGYYTAYIQTTATLGLVLSLIAVVGVQTWIGEERFLAWGWRIPFLISGLLLAIALYIRWSLRETPLFSRLKEAGKSSTSPLRDAFSGGAWKFILLVLFGATAGQAVVWYAGQFYAYVFLYDTLGLPLVRASLIVGIALTCATPFFLVFGRISDRIGRKPIIMTGCLIAALTYVPIYVLMERFSDPVNYLMLGLLVFIQGLYVTMVYGPIAAYLVELFPAKVRYTSLSVPYHLGNGEFGGLLPFMATWIVAWTGNMYAGLAYPIVVALMTAFIGWRFLPETHHVRIWDEVSGVEPATADRPATIAPGSGSTS